MMVSELAGRIGEEVADLEGRVKTAADLTELVRAKALPASPVAAFVLPLGLMPAGDGDAATGAFIQSVDESFAVVLFSRVSGDLTGGKALPAIDALVWAVIDAVCGWAPDDAVGVFYLQRGQLIDANAGGVFYQLDFGLRQQIRVIQ